MWIRSVGARYRPMYHHTRTSTTVYKCSFVSSLSLLNTLFLPSCVFSDAVGGFCPPGSAPNSCTSFPWRNRSPQLELTLGKRRLLATMFSSWAGINLERRENIPRGEKLIEPVDFFFVVAGRFSLPDCVSSFFFFFFKCPKNILAPVCGERRVERH